MFFFLLEGQLAIGNKVFHTTSVNNDQLFSFAHKNFICRWYGAIGPTTTNGAIRVEPLRLGILHFPIFSSFCYRKKSHLAIAMSVCSIITCRSVFFIKEEDCPKIAPALKYFLQYITNNSFVTVGSLSCVVKINVITNRICFGVMDVCNGFSLITFFYMESLTLSYMPLAPYLFLVMFKTVLQQIPRASTARSQTCDTVNSGPPFLSRSK